MLRKNRSLSHPDIWPLRVEQFFKVLNCTVMDILYYSKKDYKRFGKLGCNLSSAPYLEQIYIRVIIFWSEIFSTESLPKAFHNFAKSRRSKFYQNFLREVWIGITILPKISGFAFCLKNVLTSICVEGCQSFFVPWLFFLNAIKELYEDSNNYGLKLLRMKFRNFHIQNKLAATTVKLNQAQNILEPDRTFTKALIIDVPETFHWALLVFSFQNHCCDIHCMYPSKFFIFLHPS